MSRKKPPTVLAQRYQRVLEELTGEPVNVYMQRLYDAGLSADAMAAAILITWKLPVNVRTVQRWLRPIRERERA